MDGRTYYMILGVPRTESPGGIRSAYRDLARRLHPDAAGQQATHAFQEITEAYDVLSDPQRRRAYNDELRRAERGDLAPVRDAPAAPFARAPVSLPGVWAKRDDRRGDRPRSHPADGALGIDLRAAPAGLGHPQLLSAAARVFVEP